MARSFGLVEYKILEAEYFLVELSRLGEEYKFSAIQYCASAFVSAARSVTFAMQASLKDEPRFNLWYAKHQADLRENTLAKFFHDFRTVTQHVGVNVVQGGSVRNGKALFNFTACADLPTVPELDVVSACKIYFKTVLEIVYDCYIELGSVIDGQQYFTKENFAKLGKTIEDAEDELGFPRGWTQIGAKDEHLAERWELLRKNADGCEIEDVFVRWLDLKLPRSI